MNSGETCAIEPGALTHERLAPRVIDQDGVECKVGDTVWAVGDAWPSMEVLEIVPDIDLDEPKHLVWCGETCDEPVDGTKLWRHADQLTHRAPVIEADGKPLREGEKVLGANGGAYRVTGVHDGKVFAHHVGGSFGAEVESAGGEGLYRLRADQLTHERPESWERLEEDAGKSPAQYCRDRDVTGGGTTLYGGLDAAMRSDLVRRAKDLAERDR